MPGVRVALRTDKDVTPDDIKAAGIDGIIEVTGGGRVLYMENADDAMVQAAEKLAGYPPRQPPPDPLSILPRTT